jgi:predicted DNA-binding transcriptional regulator AlpA
MINVIGEELQKIVDSIKVGNSNVPEEKAISILKAVRELTDDTSKVSKYQAMRILHVERATFDGYVRDGLLPRGIKEPGFKELFWYKKDIEEFKSRRKNNKK